MRKVLIILSFLVIFVFNACATTNQEFHSGVIEPVYIDPYYSWVNNCPVKDFPSFGKCNSSWRNITVRVVNKKKNDIIVSVKCYYDLTDEEFGYNSKRIKAKDNGSLLVWGLARMISDSDDVKCEIDKIEDLI